jgi:hypothetical protein
MTYVYPVWFFLAAFFLYFAFATWRDSQEDLRQFVIRNRPQGAPMEDPGMDSSGGRQQFAGELNAYVASINARHHKRQRFGAVAYTVSGILSLASMFLLLFAR